MRMLGIAFSLAGKRVSTIADILSNGIKNESWITIKRPLSTVTLPYNRKMIQLQPNINQNSNTTITRSASSSNTEQRIEKSINEVKLLGRAGADAKMGGTDAHPVVYFSLATHSSYKAAESGEFTQKTEWHRVVVFKPNLRESVYSYLQKGQRVLVSGRLSYGEITDATGQVKPTTAVVAEDVIFFQSKS